VFASEDGRSVTVLSRLNKGFSQVTPSVDDADKEALCTMSDFLLSDLKAVIMVEYVGEKRCFGGMRISAAEHSALISLATAAPVVFDVFKLSGKKDWASMEAVKQRVKKSTRLILSVPVPPMQGIRLESIGASLLRSFQPTSSLTAPISLAYTSAASRLHPNYPQHQFGRRSKLLRVEGCCRDGSVLKIQTLRQCFASFKQGGLESLCQEMVHFKLLSPKPFLVYFLPVEIVDNVSVAVSPDKAVNLHVIPIDSTTRPPLAGEFCTSR